MGNIGLLKRALPFFATFAFGLFIARFFVNISPRFEHHERGRCHHDMWEMRIENEQLREENKRLRERHGPMQEFPVDPPVYFENEDLESPDVGQPVLLPPPPPVKSHKVHAR